MFFPFLLNTYTLAAIMANGVQIGGLWMKVRRVSNGQNFLFGAINTNA